jgi:hypothetical protein
MNHGPQSTQQVDRSAPPMAVWRTPMLAEDLN